MVDTEGKKPQMADINQTGTVGSIDGIDPTTKPPPPVEGETLARQQEVLLMIVQIGRAHRAKKKSYEDPGPTTGGTVLDDYADGPR
eukprot:gene8912-10562_t